MAPQNILLDSDIRDWVVLPLFVIMVSAGLLRVHMGHLLKPAPKNTTRVTQRSASAIRAASSLKSGAIHFLGTPKLESRKLAYPEILRDQAEWCETCLEEEEQAKKENQDDDDMPNPMAQMEGMAGNMVFMVRLGGPMLFGPAVPMNFRTDHFDFIHALLPIAHSFRSKIW
jgi:ER membrane protein complex subunit 3